MRTLTAALLLLLCASVAPLAQPQVNPSAFGELRWRSIGPPRSGYIAAPAGVPGDPTTYYAGLPEGGIWKTTNGGTTWKPIFDDVHVASVGAVAVAPSDHNVVYAGTGNLSSWAFTPGNGVYKSTDAGHTWTHVGLARSQFIGGIVIDPRNPNAVLVAAQGPRPAGRGEAPPPSADAERGVYRTTDGGATWTRVLPADGASGASDVYLDYGDPQMVFAMLGNAPGPGVPAQQGPAGTGVFKSTDGGATWNPVGARGLPENARITAFAVSSGTHGRRLYAVAITGGGRGAGRGGASRGLYRSDDGGESWTFGTRDLASAGGKMYADPQNPDVVYVMGTAIYKSTDAGQHVAAFWGAPSGADPRFLWIDPTNSKRMMAGVDQGPAISVDGGATWTPYYGMVNGQFYRVATDYEFPYHVCGPQQDSGTACVASRSDFGEIRPYDWYTGGGFENGFLIADPKDPRYLYTQGWYHVLRRYDRQTGQDVVLYQPAPEDRFGGAPPLAFSPKDARTLYMAAQHVMASDDRGITWRTISPDLAAPKGVTLPAAATAGGSTVSGPAAGGSIQALALSPVDPTVIWAGASTGLVHVTRDGGRSWTNVTPKDLPPAAINIIDASHADAGTAYVALLSRDARPHLYRTRDFGQNWQEIVNGITGEGTARVVREDPADPSILYAGTVTGAWVSFDRGDHWQSLQLNLPTTVVSDMTVHDADLVISTYGRGFWILDNVSPLRQARAALGSAAPYLFRPEAASRARWDNTQDTPLPPEMVVGENPLEGAVIDYYLPSAADSVKITISDSQGHAIREFTNTAPAADNSMPNVPEYWLMPLTALATTPGMHRMNWDLRYPDPPTLNYGYSGTLLDYREYTLSWHAIPGKTPRSTLVGPMVLPGRYTVTLAAGGKTVSQPLTVKQDPRINVPDAGLKAQFDLQQRMVAGITTTYHAVTYIDSVRKALEDARARNVSTQSAGLDAVEKAIAPLTGSSGTFGLAHRDLSRRLNDQLVADMTPPPSVVAGVDTPCKAVDEALMAVRALQPKVAALSLPTWTAPASACGK